MSLHEKLVIIQSALKAPKNQRNTFGNYNYRSCEDILEALKPLLKEHNLTLSLSDQVTASTANAEYTYTDDNKGKTDKNGTPYAPKLVPIIQSEPVIFITSTATISDGTETISVTGVAGVATHKKGMDISQSYGSSSSYARKYALNGLFCIDDTKDADSNEYAPKDVPASSQPQPKFVSNTPNVF